jgi:hypothetical protein
MVYNRPSYTTFLPHYPLDLFLRQPVKLVHKLINRFIHRLNLPGQHRPLLFEPRILQFLVQVKHLCDERGHAVVAGYV